MSPEYLAPGVYVEEVSFRVHPIDGVPTTTGQELHAVATHFWKHRRVRVLLTGTGKPGKLNAARELARELRMNLYRVELSEVVSQYIGDTEKNLSAVFAAADKGDAILFFDEADALFGKRSEVKDAYDRYAAIEIDYLLQRLEEFEGVAILGVAAKEHLDPGILRGVQFTISIPPVRFRPPTPSWVRCLGIALGVLVGLIVILEITHPALARKGEE